MKGNQETLHQAVIDYIDEQLEGDLSGAQEHVTTEKGHGREETRVYLQLPAPEKLPGFMMWKGLKSIGLVTSCCVRDGKETTEFRYYISSLPTEAKQFARAVRGHWGIENGCHWSLDMTFREDESRLRERHSRELRLDKPVCLVALEAASRQTKPDHETPQLWLERHLLDGSRYWINMLVCAGPDRASPSQLGRSWAFWGGRSSC